MVHPVIDDMQEMLIQTQTRASKILVVPALSLFFSLYRMKKNEKIELTLWE